MPRLFEDGAFRLVCNSTHTSFQARECITVDYATATQHTYNMATVSVANRTTSMSPHVFYLKIPTG